MMKSETNLDERQELKLLEIEHNGLWLAFWGLLASIILQAIFFTKPENLVGEWFVFMCLAVYPVAACVKNGIWDRKLKPDFKNKRRCQSRSGSRYGAFVCRHSFCV